jgi:hypothetical protein
MFCSLSQFSQNAEYRYAEYHYAEYRYAEYRYAEYRYAEYCYAEYHYAEYRYAEYRYAECSGVILFQNVQNVQASLLSSPSSYDRKMIYTIDP